MALLSVRDTFAERHMAQYHRRISCRVDLGHFWLSRVIPSIGITGGGICLFLHVIDNIIFAFSGVETEVASIHPAVDNTIILEDIKSLGFLILL